MCAYKSHFLCAHGGFCLQTETVEEPIEEEEAEKEAEKEAAEDEAEVEEEEEDKDKPKTKKVWGFYLSFFIKEGWLCCQVASNPNVVKSCSPAKSFCLGGEDCVGLGADE